MSEAVRAEPAVARRAAEGAGAGGRRAGHHLPGTMERSRAARHALADRVARGQAARRRPEGRGRCRSSHRTRRRAARTPCRCCAPIRTRTSSTTSHRTVSAASPAATSKAVPRARRLIYLEDQYLWSKRVAELFASALADNPELHLVAVVPRHPDVDGRLALPPNQVGRQQAIETCRSAQPGAGARLRRREPRGHTRLRARQGVCHRRHLGHASEATTSIAGPGLMTANCRARCWTTRRIRTGPAVEAAARASRPGGRRQRGRRTCRLDTVVEAIETSAQALEDWHVRRSQGPPATRPAASTPFGEARLTDPVVGRSGVPGDLRPRRTVLSRSAQGS